MSGQRYGLTQFITCKKLTSMITTIIIVSTLILTLNDAIQSIPKYSEVENDEDKLTISLKNKRPPTTFLGRAVIPISSLSDEAAKEEWYSLIDNNGAEAGKILLDLVFHRVQVDVSRKTQRPTTRIGTYFFYFVYVEYYSTRCQT